jgi:hypothetical protein
LAGLTAFDDVQVSVPEVFLPLARAGAQAAQPSDAQLLEQMRLNSR